MSNVVSLAQHGASSVKARFHDPVFDDRDYSKPDIRDCVRLAPIHLWAGEGPTPLLPAKAFRDLLDTVAVRAEFSEVIRMMLHEISERDEIIAGLIGVPNPAGAESTELNEACAARVLKRIEPRHFECYQARMSDGCYPF